MRATTITIPDTSRPDLIEAAKKKLATGYYDNDFVTDVVVERMLDDLEKTDGNNEHENA
jgi:hypothetical protein